VFGNGKKLRKKRFIFCSNGTELQQRYGTHKSASLDFTTTQTQRQTERC
jgi:hypothetical protein